MSYTLYMFNDCNSTATTTRDMEENSSLTRKYCNNLGSSRRMGFLIEINGNCPKLEAIEITYTQGKS